MTESPESPTTPTGSGAAPAPVRPPEGDGRDRRLHRTLAWVGIVSGVVFTVAVIFFSGLALGRATGGYHSWHRDYQSGQMGPGGGCPMMHGGKTGSGPMGPGMMGPDSMGPGMMRPGQPSAAPAPPSPPQR